MSGTFGIAHALRALAVASTAALVGCAGQAAGVGGAPQVQSAAEQGSRDAGAAGGNVGTATRSPSGTPVGRWGNLGVCGTRLCSAGGTPVQLKGASTQWLNWEGTYSVNKGAMQWLRDNWNLSVFRAAMGISPGGAYATDPAKMKAMVETIIQNAIDLGVYVIVDWHDHEAHLRRDLAVAFFAGMAEKWGRHPNVLWETYNEPKKVDWSPILKPYHEAVVAAIRSRDPDNVIILGTPQWSQLVDQAADDPLSGTNLMYTLHFYSCSHKQWLRDVASGALAKGLPLFVTEWGATHADGGLDGLVCLDEAQVWHEWMNAKGISWTAWKLVGCRPDSSCILQVGAPAAGGWSDEWLYGHGSFVRDRMKE